jgi:beta-lactamase regulating signal transducer with metallopeptidase domain
MSVLDSIASGPLVTALGWALVHFIWQGTLVAVALAAALYLLRRRAANARYAACCAAMLLMVLAPVVTFLALLGGPAPVVSVTGDLPPGDAGTAATWGWLAGVLPQLTALWIAGVCLFQLRVFVQWTNARRLTRRGTHHAAEALQRSVADLCGRLGIRRPVRIFETTRAAVPMLIGWLRPVILVPAGAVTGLSPQQLRAVLAHELAHVRRHDYLVNVLQAIVESLLFYHPAVWWVSHRVRVEREYCCDDVAVGVGGDALSYAQALSYLDALRGDFSEPALASTGGTLMNRIRRLVGLQTLPPKRLGGWLAPAAAMLAVAVTLSAVALARPVETKQTPAPDLEVVLEAPQSDVVAVLESIDAKEAPLFRTLRDAGLNDRMLVMVLEAMEPEPEILEAVKAAGGRRALAVRLRRFHERLDAGVEAGRISEEEAQRRLEHVQQEIHERMASGVADGRRPRGARFHGKRDLERIEKRVQEELEAGTITDTEAKERLEQARLRHLRGVVEDEVRQEIAKRIAERVEAVHAEIERRLAAGEITEDEAHEQLERIRQEIHERIGKRMRGGRPHLPPEMLQRMKAVHDEIRAALEAGEITEAEARQRLDEARGALQEELDSQRDEPRRERPRPERPRRRGAADGGDEPGLDL